MNNCKVNTNLLSVGIDVSMDTLMVCEHYYDNRNKINEISNSEVSIKRLASKLKNNNFLGKIIMESTGRHHMLSSIIFSENNLDIRVINPLITKKYSSSSIRKVKTDKRDSEILAEIGIKENNLPEPFKLDRTGLALRKKMRLIASLSRQLQNMHTCANEHKKTLAGLKCKLSPMEKQIFKTIALMRKQKERLEQELEKDIRDLNKRNNEQTEKYSSVPGVSSYVASLATLIFSNEYSQSAKQWIAFIGLDVSVKQSAKWIGKGHLTKRGNDYLRKRFFSAAWGATMHNEKFKEYYDYLIGKKNRKHKEALIIIARKIIGILFNLNKNNTTYDSAKPLYVAS